MTRPVRPPNFVKASVRPCAALLRAGPAAEATRLRPSVACEVVDVLAFVVVDSHLAVDLAMSPRVSVERRIS